MSAAPQFSVIIPSYNRAHLVGKTIESVLGQEFSNFELLIVDDGSKDNTEEVVRSFSDGRVRYHKKENAERGAARNYGTARAAGSYVNFFDSDDLMYPNHLTTANRLATALGNPEFFHLGFDYRDEDGTLVKKVNHFDDSLCDTILFDNKLSCNGVFVRRDIALQFPFEEERILASSEDWELWIRLLSRFTLYYSNEITSTVVNHDQRSLLTIQPDRVVARDLLFIEKLKQDPVVVRNYGRSLKRFIAERYTFFMLGFAEQRQPAKVLKWALRAIQVHPLILFTRRFLASIKNSILG